MTERPILMTPENAQKCHDGTKTQTRRIVKRTDSGRVKLVGSVKNWHLDDPFAVQACPYGVVGDRLWIRHATWRPRRSGGGRQCWNPITKEVIWENGAKVENVSGVDEAAWVKVTSIHMPRWACRTLVEITEVRVERLQEISDTNAILEGCVHAYGLDYHVGAFRNLWESINGKDSWKANPWVWVITFNKI